MKYTDETLMVNKQPVPVHVFKPESEPKAIIQFIYGVKSNVSRYADAIVNLTNQGYIVVCTDLIEHGKNLNQIVNEENNTICKKIPHGKSIFKATANEQMKTLMSIRESSDLPFFVLAHSYGGYITMNLFSHPYFNADGVILTGVGDVRHPKTAIQNAVLKVANKVYKKNYKQSFVITKENNAVYLDKPLANPKTIGGVSIKLAADLSSTLLNKELYDTEKMKSNLENTPVMLITGENDPKTYNSKATKKLFNEMKAAKIVCECNIIPNAEHAVLRKIDTDTNAPVAMPYINNFLNAVLTHSYSIEQNKSK